MSAAIGGFIIGLITGGSLGTIVVDVLVAGRDGEQ